MCQYIKKKTLKNSIEIIVGHLLNNPAPVLLKPHSIKQSLAIKLE